MRVEAAPHFSRSTGGRCCRIVRGQMGAQPSHRCGSELVRFFCAASVRKFLQTVADAPSYQNARRIIAEGPGAIDRLETALNKGVISLPVLAAIFAGGMD